MVAFTSNLKDKDLVISLYLNLLEDFDNIIDMIKDHMIVNATLQSTDDESPKP